MSKKLISMLLALVMVLSLAAPVIPAAAEETEAVSETVSESTSDLRMGVLSDIHISYDYVDEVYGNVTGHFNGVQPSRFEKALRFFKAQGVDAVVVAGDLQEASGTDAANLDKQKDWLQTVVDIWFKVFPEKQGEEGYVEPIFIYGNHDSALVSNQYWPEELGSYEDAFIKEVNGYSFVCAHNAKENLATPLLEKVAPQNADKPIFYIQHCPVAYTVPGDYGYGSGYGQVGWNNVAPYHNAVVFNGHTHAPLTDERCIWQGDEGNEGQFTVINTATINYTGLSNDGMSVNSYAGNAQQTEHGMLVDVYGSELNIERYSFNDMTIDTDSGAVSGEPVKIGETWSFDACDATDRPYAYDSRHANANAPVFPEGAQITVESIIDTAVTVSLPAASLTAPAGFSDMIEGYVVEACDPTSGKVEAVGRVATSYHVDDKADVYEATYTVKVSGLKAGTNYILKAYAQEFFDKRSQALELAVTTTGELASYRVGDLDKNGTVDAEDLAYLNEVLSDTGNDLYNGDADIDGNGILEYRDVTELQAILDGSRVAYPESDDLMDLVSAVKLTGVSTSTKYQPVDYGTKIQNSVVRGNSNQAVKTWTTNYAYYPITTMYFSEPVDLSGYTHLSFDTLFENEYNLSDSYRKRWLSLSFISGEQEQVASYGSMNFDSAGDGWTTTTVALVNLKNIDLSAVTGIRFSHNFDYYEGRFDGVTEHAIYWDNFYGSTAEGADTDLLYTATIDGGEAIYGAGYTKNSNHAVLSTGGTVDVTLEKSLVLSDYAGFNVYMRTPVSTTVSVQPYDAEGNLLGTAASIESTYIYQNKTISTANFAVEEGTVAAGLRFTYSCESLLLDTMSVRASKDTDLIGTADGVAAIGEGVSANIVLDGTNGSNNALYVAAENQVSGGVELSFAEALDLSQAPYLRLDLKMENTDTGFAVSLYDAEDTAVWTSGDMTAASSEGNYATYELDMSTADLSEVAKIAVSFDLAADGEVWIDNLKACDPMGDFFSASTSLIGPSAVQDGFICEISDFDGHDNVLHWYSDPAANAGTNSAWPGETVIYTWKDVNVLNHTGYTGSYDYLEFDIKTSGMYIAMYLTVKDASGATLGTTGEYRISYDQEWSTFRVDAATLKMSAEDFNKIAQVTIGWNWQHQHINGTVARYVADVYIDNMGLRSIPAESKDMLDSLTLVQNSDWWTGANGKFTGGGWKFQSEVTADSDDALMFYRSATSQGISYGSKTLYMYFNEPIALESGWSVKLDAIKHNYNASGAKVQIIGSDNAKYDLFSFTHAEAGVHSYSTLVDAISGFDPETTTVKGLYFTYPMNPDSTMDKAANGYLVLDNLSVFIPEPMDEDDFLYTATCPVGENQTAVTNHSLSAWKITPTATGWSYPQFTMAAPVDISNHTLTFDFMATNMTNFRMLLANINGDWAAETLATYYDCDKWYTVSFDLSENGAGITSMERFSLGICFGSDTDDYALYIDNVSLTENVEEPEPTEPETTEPEVTEPETTVDTASPNAEDPGDMLGATDTISYNKAYWDNYDGTDTGLTAVVDTETVYGSASTRSWSFKATAAANNAETVAQFAMKHPYDLTGKVLVFDVKFDSTDATQTLALKTRLHEADTWHDVSTNISSTVKAGYWQTVALDFSGSIVNGKDLTQVQEITFTMNFASNTGTERAVYIDNVRLADVETIEDDLIHCKVDGGSTGNLYWVTDEYTYGDSSLSIRVENKTSGDNDIYYNTQSQFGNDNLPNFKNKIFSAYFYFGEQTPYATLQLVDKNWSGVNASPFRFEAIGDGWYLGQVNTTQITTHAATTDLSQCIRFSINIAPGAVVYVDDLKVLPGETVDADWTNMCLDSGATKGEWGPNTEYTYSEGSLVSLRYQPTGGSYISFHTQNEVNRNGGAWDVYPDFSEGIISAYIYFGDQTPSVKLQLTDTAWKNSTSTAMNLEPVGDGWYHATIDVSSITVPDGFNPQQIIRIYLTFTAGQTVYIDDMHLQPVPNNMEDHLANSPGVCRPASGIESGYVIEILDSYDGYSNVFHVNSDPNNGGGTTTNWPAQPSYYVAASGSGYDAADYDYYEFSFKGTGHYSDISVSFLDAGGATLGSVSGFRLSHKEADWMTFRIDVASAGLTADEIKLVRRVSFGFNWQYQNVGGTALLEADLYFANCGFRANNEESADLLDQIHSIKNSDYWYGGYNNYPGAGWYFDDEGAFTFYRSPETTGMGYNPRNMYVYFKTPVTVENGQRLSLDVVNTNFPQKSKIEVIGSDGKYYVFGTIAEAGSYNVTVIANSMATSDGVAFDPDTVTIKGLKFHNNFNADSTVDSTVGGTLAYNNFVILPALPNALDDAIANYTSLTKPSAVEDGFVCEVLAETDDGHTDVIHWYADPNNGAGTTSNWPGTTKLYVEAPPEYVDTAAYDYLEFGYKHYGVKYWFSIAVYDTDGNKIGNNGTTHSGASEWRTSGESGWATHRIDLDTMGLTAEELKTVGCFEISVSWEYNNASGTTLKVGEMWIDDLRFGCVDEESTDLMDHVVETDLYKDNGATVGFVGSDWYWNEDGAFTITRSPSSDGWRAIRLYFDEAITVDSDWTVSCDFDIANFHHGGSIGLIGSDGNVYTSIAPNSGGQKTVSKAVTAFVNGSTAFDPATVQIVGIKISYSLGTSTTVTDTTAGGYMSMDNLILTDSTP